MIVPFLTVTFLNFEVYHTNLITKRSMEASIFREKIYEKLIDKEKFAKKEDEIKKEIDDSLKEIKNKKRENRFFIILVILFVLALTLPVTGVVKTIFFEEEDSEFIFLEPFFIFHIPFDINLVLIMAVIRVLSSIVI